MAGRRRKNLPALVEFPPDQLRAIHLTLEGMSQTDIALELDIGRETLRRWRNNRVWRERFEEEKGYYDDAARDMPITSRRVRLGQIQRLLDGLEDIVASEAKDYVALAAAVSGLLESVRREMATPSLPELPASGKAVEAEWSTDAADPGNDADRLRMFCDEVESMARTVEAMDGTVAEFLATLRHMIPATPTED